MDGYRCDFFTLYSASDGTTVNPTAGSIAGVCQVSAALYICLMSVFAAIAGTVAWSTWRAWYAKKKAFGARTRPPVLAVIYTFECIDVALLAALPGSGVATAANGVPLMLIGFVSVLHFTLVGVVVLRYVQLGQRVFRYTDALSAEDDRADNAGLPSDASSSSAPQQNSSAEAAATTKTQMFKKLDSAMIVLLVLQTMGILGDVVLCFVAIGLPTDVRVLYAFQLLWILQSVLTCVSMNYHVYRLHRALKDNRMEDARMRKVRRMLATSLVVSITLGGVAPVLFGLFIGPLYSWQGGSFALIFVGLVTSIHASIHLNVLVSKRRMRTAKDRPLNVAVAADRTEPSSGAVRSNATPP